MLHTSNNIVHTLLFQASMPPQYWVESLHTVYNTSPTYEHLRVFRCVCYPYLSAIGPHKLAPHSTWCVFIGYSLDHKGYRYTDLSTNHVMIS
jgi:hypothetical protein